MILYNQSQLGSLGHCQLLEARARRHGTSPSACWRPKEKNENCHVFFG